VGRTFGYFDPYVFDPVVCALAELPAEYLPARQSVAIESQQLTLFAHHYENYGFEPDVFLEQAREWMLSEFAPYIPESTSNRYSFDEACTRCISACGSKAPGVYWREKGYKTKTSVIECCREELQQRVNDYFANGFCWYEWQASLKVELVKAVKHESCDTRLFTVAPIEHYIACLMTFGGFCDVIFTTAGFHPIFVGFPKQYGGVIERVFMKLGSRNSAIDAKKYDTSLIPLVLYYAACVLLKAAQRPGAYVLVIETIYCMLVSSMGNVYLKDGGNASGGFLTLILNCFVQILLAARANFKHCGCSIGSDLVLRAVGDDGLYTYVNCRLTRDLLIASFADYGVVLKDVVFGGPEEMEFCGCHYKNGRLTVRERKLYCAMFWSQRLDPESRAIRLASLYQDLFEDPLYASICSSAYSHIVQFFHLDLPELPSYDRLMEIRYGKPVSSNHVPVYESFLGFERQSLSMPQNRKRQNLLGYPLRRGPIANNAAAPSPAKRKRNRRRRPRRARRAQPLVVRRAPAMSRTGAEVRDCSWDYLACMLNPRDGPLGCRPDIYAQPSSVFRTILKTTLSTGSNLYGFALLNPLAAMTNDQSALFTTTASYNASPAVFATSGTGVTQSSFSTGMFANAAFTATAGGIQGRVIAAELRVMSYTNPLSIAGYSVPYETPDHQQLLNVNLLDPGMYAGVEYVPNVPGKWISVRWSGPLSKLERDYTGQPATDSTPSMGIGIATVTGYPLLWAVEAYVVYEVIGSKNAAPRPVSQDSAGLSWVNSKLSELGPQAMQRVKDSSIWTKAMAGVSSTALAALGASAAGPMVTGLVRAAGAYAGSAMYVGSRMLM
jgi:hypothetical protein